MKTVIKVPNTSRVLLLEDSLERISWFKNVLLNIQCLDIVSTVDDAIKAISTSKVPYDCFFLDHDLGFMDQFGNPGSCGDGYQFAKHLADNNFLAKNVVIHSWNPYGAKKMKDCLPDATVIPWGKFDIELV